VQEAPEPLKRHATKKQRVLHTRIPERLEQELKERASELGLSVSNLVRNVLHNTFDMVEGVVADTGDLARAVGGSRPASRTAPSAKTLGWQELVLDLNAVCQQCNEILPRGSRAALAIPSDPQHPRFRCLNCIPSPPEED
jgi:hypothetical protein